MSGRKFQLGPIRDIAVIGGVNFGADANVFKYLPGVRASWKVPGFAFLNTDLTAYIDGNSGAEGGGAPGPATASCSMSVGRCPSDWAANCS